MSRALETCPSPRRAPSAGRLAAYLAASLGAGALGTDASAALISINLKTIGSPNADVSAVNGGSTGGGINYAVPVGNGSAFGALAGNGSFGLYGFSGNVTFGANAGTPYEPGSPGYPGSPGSYDAGCECTVGYLPFVPPTAPTLAAPGGPVILTAGQTIGIGFLTFREGIDSLFAYDGWAFSDVTGPGNYMGFYDADNDVYGWLEVTWNSTSNEFYILSGCYNSEATQSITAGSCDSGGGGVPEPDSLALLALGAVGLAGARRRRKAH